MADRLTYNVIDDEGERAMTGVWLQAALNTDIQTTYAALTNAIQGAIVGGVNTVSGSAIYEPGSAAGAGAYQNAEDKAALLFQSSVGNIVTLELPTPDAAIFEADNETVDPTDVLITTLVTQILAFAADKAGNAIIELVRGYRRRARTRV